MTSMRSSTGLVVQNSIGESVDLFDEEADGPG